MDFQIFSDYFQYFIISIILKNEKIFGIFWGIVKSIFTTEVKTKVTKRMNINFTSVKTDSARLFVCFFFLCSNEGEEERPLAKFRVRLVRWFVVSDSWIARAVSCVRFSIGVHTEARARSSGRSISHRKLLAREALFYLFHLFIPSHWWPLAPTLPSLHNRRKHWSGLEKSLQIFFSSILFQTIASTDTKA